MVGLPWCATYAATYAPWLRQIGMSDSIGSASKWGQGQIIGIVDTGIKANHPQFAPGQVITSKSGCSAVSFACSSGVNDDNGHGTAVASIAAGNRGSMFSSITGGGYTTRYGDLIGVAPSANITAHKVLNANGSGYSTDVANGVKQAADAGAGVINVSITFSNSPDIISAINYAASKGAFIVWAGGNSAQNFLGGAQTAGLTPEALKRTTFVGSVNSANANSSFTNKPGVGTIRTTDGKLTSYKDRWIMAPGEAILAPYAPGGDTAYRLWSGTSMAAPIIAGSATLLNAAWPILKTNGTTLDLLLATAKDVGVKGSDGVYGKGVVNLAAAFNPQGALVTYAANGKTYNVSTLTGATLTSGALGNYSAIQSTLSNYTAFDAYQRNYSVNLSKLITSRTTKGGTVNAIPLAAMSAPIRMQVGSAFMYSQMSSSNVGGDAHSNLGQLEYTPQFDNGRGFSLFENGGGEVVGMYFGADGTFAQAKSSLNDDVIALHMSGVGGSGYASALGQGGGQSGANSGFGVVYGLKLDENHRLSFDYSSAMMPGSTRMDYSPEALKASTTLSRKIGQGEYVALSYSMLNEKNGLLGDVYTNSSALSLGQNSSHVFGLTYARKLDAKSSFIGAFEYAVTNSSGHDGLISDVQGVRSTAAKLSYMLQDVVSQNDRFTLTLKQPMRAESMTAYLRTATVDANGLPVFRDQKFDLTPTGRQLDFELGYAFKLLGGEMNTRISYQKDYLNIDGNDNQAAGFLYRQDF